MFKVKGKSVAVIGGGAVAKRHVLKLMRAGLSEIYVYSPRIEENLQSLHARKKIIWVEGEVQHSQRFKEDIVFITTNDSHLNVAVCLNCRPNQLVYLADHPDLSDFQFPNTLEKGLLTLALSTGGTSPTYGKQLMNDLESLLSDTIEDDLEFLAEARQKVLASGLDGQIRKSILKKIATKTFLKDPEREIQFRQLLEEYLKKEAGT